MNRTIPVLIAVALLLLLLPTAEATWTTSSGVPSSFRPNRAVTFIYTAQSSSATDLPLNWRVELMTCQDANANTWCDLGELQRVSHGERTINILGGQSLTVQWTVNLAQPVGAYRYHFNTICNANPCTGLQQPGGAHNRTGAFQLAYTNTWTRAIFATTPISTNDVQTVQYRLQSTGPDDADLAGTARLYSTPPGLVERDHGAKPISVLAGQTQTLNWPNINHPGIGIQRLRVTDTTAGSDATFDVQVRGLHLHVSAPRENYTAGNAFSLYIRLEGHGTTPDPKPLLGETLAVRVSNGTFVVFQNDVVTDSEGQTYVRFDTAEDHDELDWYVFNTLSWMGDDYDVEASGTIRVQRSPLGGIAENLTEVRTDIETVQLKGVHLDDVGSRNLWMTSLRAAGGASLVGLLILFVAYVAIRV